MPPPKFKLHKTSGKARPVPPQTNVQPSQPGTSTGNNSSELTEEQKQQFQVELYWCIQQLQTALATNKLPPKQIQEHTKALNTLMSSNAPMVKKRQVMRLSFGDYRAKMLEDEKKTKSTSIKVGTSKPSEKSVFLRRALTTNAENNFKFNFPTPEKDTVSQQPNNAIETNPNPIQTPKSLVFTKSDNSFRFNFSTSHSNS